MNEIDRIILIFIWMIYPYSTVENIAYLLNYSYSISFKLLGLYNKKVVCL